MGRTEQAPVAPPSTDGTARYVGALYARVLGLSEVGDVDDFFVLGGTSLSAMDLLALVREELGVQVPVREFYSATTVAELAATVDRLREEQAGGA